MLGQGLRGLLSKRKGKVQTNLLRLSGDDRELHRGRRNQHEVVDLPLAGQLDLVRPGLHDVRLGQRHVVFAHV